MMPSMLTPGSAIKLWSDGHGAAAGGWREYLVIARARKWSTLVLLSTGEKVRLENAAIDSMKPEPITYPKARMRRRLRANATTFGHLASTAVKDALVLLR